MRNCHLFLKVLVSIACLFCWVETQPLWAQQAGATNRAATAAATAEPQAASQTVASPPAVIPPLPVPRLIKFSGTLRDPSGQPRTGTIGLTFSIYNEQEGGSTLWMETHNVELDAQGHYSVLLGSQQSEGMPLDLFATGDPRWLGVKVELPGEVEQPRVLLVSVPYALKASDADTLGGKPVSAFVLAEGTQGAESSTTSGTGATGTSTVVGAISPEQVGGSGTPNQVAKFTTNGTTIGNSAIAEVNGNVGVGISPPSNQLFVLAVPATDTIAMNMTNTVDQDMLINVTAPGAANPVGEIGPTTATNLGLQVGGAEKVRITNNGNVWIGSKPSSPAADTQRLVIAVPSTDTIAMNMSNLVDQDLVVSVSPPGAAQKMGIIGPTTPTALGLQVGGATKALITNAGMVGIGTTTPSQMLTVAGTIRSTTGGFMFPDGTTQTTAATGGGGSITAVNTPAGGGLMGGGSSGALNLGLLNSCASGQVLQWTGTAWACATVSSAAGVTSVGQGTGIIASPNPIISSGTVSIDTAVVPQLGANNTFTANQSVVASASGATALSVQATNLNTANTAIDGLADGAGGTGVIGEAENGSVAIGVWGISSSGVAGEFSGNVQVTGSLSKAGGSFKIDDPVDPANKYLYHSFVESPDMKNIYDGVVQLDAQGEAVVQLPDWFQALNRDFRYQLTCIGGFAPVYIAQEVAANQFKIAGGKPGMKVSWMVTGIRQDAWANANRIPVEQDKPVQERGYYLHPSLYGAPPEKSVEWARHPEIMKNRSRTSGESPERK